MSERPFMQLYVSDYLGDTRHLSCEQHGAYLLLLMTMWNAAGSLPDDDKKLARCVGLTLKKWRAIRTEVAEFFDIENGVWTHRRLLKEFQKSEGKSELRRSAGALGYAAKALKNNKPAQANAVGLPKHSPEPYRKKAKLDSVPTESPVAVDINKHVNPELFARCVALTEPVKDFIEHKTFPADVVAQARREMSN